MHEYTRIFRPYPYPPLYVQPLKDNNQSARATDQRKIFTTCVALLGKQSPPAPLLQRNNKHA